MIKEKLSDAIERMNPGDEWKSSNFHAIMASDRIMITCQGARLKMYDGISRELGEIIRAEPEVLTAGEMLNKIACMGEFKHHIVWEHVEKAIELADKNGQIKEWKRLKSLIDNAKKYFIDGNRTTYEDIQGTLMNIIPPWEPEKQ